MPRGAARTQGSSGEYINHFNMVRMRVNGEGTLKLKLHSLQSVRSEQLADIQMSETTDIQPRVLANFSTQRAALEGKTVSINDYFKINRIIIYSRPLFSEYPG